MTDNKLILIVDDEEGIRESFNLILSDKYNVHLAPDAKSAFDFIEINSPDMIFMDIKMPEINGIEALKIIKQHKPEVPVVIVTGYQSLETAKAAVEAGAKDYIVKPFETAEILNLTSKILG